VRVDVDVSDLLKWARYFERIPRESKAALSRALNTVGHNVAENMTSYLSDATGLDKHDIANMIAIKEASPDDLEWSLDATKVMGQSGSRPWENRDTSTFEQQTLVKIVTLEDGHDCDICNEAAEASPYTLEQIKEMRAKWENFTPSDHGPAPGERTNLVHPNCRCVLQPWKATQRSFSASMGGMPPELMNVKQLSEAVREELKLILRPGR
jgi:hypothetical protein